WTHPVRAAVAARMCAVAEGLDRDEDHDEHEAGRHDPPARGTWRCRWIGWHRGTHAKHGVRHYPGKRRTAGQHSVFFCRRTVTIAPPSAARRVLAGVRRRHRLV